MKFNYYAVLSYTLFCTEPKHRLEGSGANSDVLRIIRDTPEFDDIFMLFHCQNFR